MCECVNALVIIHEVPPWCAVGLADNYLQNKENVGETIREIASAAGVSDSIIPSMTEGGNPKDNAMAERINSTVKDEQLNPAEGHKSDNLNQ